MYILRIVLHYSGLLPLSPYSVVVLHALVDSSCLASTLHIITTSDVCGPEVCRLAGLGPVRTNGEPAMGSKETVNSKGTPSESSWVCPACQHNTIQYSLHKRTCRSFNLPYILHSSLHWLFTISQLLCKCSSLMHMDANAHLTSFPSCPEDPPLPHLPARALSLTALFVSQIMVLYFSLLLLCTHAWVERRTPS